MVTVVVTVVATVVATVVEEEDFTHRPPLVLLLGPILSKFYPYPQLLLIVDSSLQFVGFMT